jgi:TATA-box binding protein (TBP) (component of TFIID and TFIIIB)
MDLNEEWESFLTHPSKEVEKASLVCHKEAPQSSDLYVSTNTIISFLNQPIDLKTTFWNIPVLPYHADSTGVIKKQMKFNSTSAEEVDIIESKLQQYEYGYNTILQHIDNAKGMIKYKDIRKVTVGLSKKDIISYRVKDKGAFYNCFVLIIRVYIKVFKEFHVKVFNTGKIEIPGVQNQEHIAYIIEALLVALRPDYPTIMYNKSCEETVLINSNFNCGYFINRASLYSILKSTYFISTVYDPCSYPGIQCKIYYSDKVSTTPCDISVSFMIFRTGSILIVGKCSERVIRDIYEYLATILVKEYASIVDHNCIHSKKETTVRKIKKYILLKETI